MTSNPKNPVPKRKNVEGSGVGDISLATPPTEPADSVYELAADVILKDSPELMPKTWPELMPVN